MNSLNNQPKKPVADRKSVFQHAFSTEVKLKTPFFILYVLANFVCVLLPIAIELLNQRRYGLEPSYVMYYEAELVFYPILAFLLGIIQFSYLNNRRAMDVFAALPISRGGMYGAKILSGFFILLVPYLVIQTGVFCFNIGVVGFVPELLWEYLALCFEVALWMLVAYGITALISSLTGTLLESIIYSLLLLFAPVLLVLCVWGVLSQCIYGFTVPDILTSSWIYLMPFSGMLVFFENGWGLSNAMLENHQNLWDLSGNTLWSSLIWFAAGIVFLALGWYFFKRRKTEVAGQKYAGGVLNTISCFLLSFMSGSLAYLICVSSDYQERSILYNLRFVVFFITTVLVFIAFQLLIYRNFKMVLESYKKYLCGLPFYFLFTLLLLTNGFGNLNQIPRAEEIAKVSISGNFFYEYLNENYYNSGDIISEGFATADPKLVEMVVKIDQEIKEQEEEKFSDSYDVINIRYYLKNGKTMTKHYYPFNMEKVPALIELMENESFIRKTDQSFSKQLVRCDRLAFYDLMGTRQTNFTREEFDFAGLRKAMQQDALERTVSNSVRKVGRLEFSYLKSNAELGLEEEWENTTYAFPFEIYESDRHTLAFLKEKGLENVFEIDEEKISELFLLPGEEFLYVLNEYFVEDGQIKLNYDSYYLPEGNMDIDRIGYREMESQALYHTKEQGKIHTILQYCSTQAEEKSDYLLAVAKVLDEDTGYRFWAYLVSEDLVLE
jgi:ABC-type transport system involved in multi-copper enzyme maturation permease subunit